MPDGYVGIPEAIARSADLKHGNDATLDAAKNIRGALEGGYLRAIGLDRKSGDLFPIAPADWRRTMRPDRSRPYGRVVQVDVFGEALNGKPIECHRGPLSDSTVEVYPMIAEADLARWSGLAAEPGPADFPRGHKVSVAVPSLPNTAGERAKDFLHGYAAACQDLRAAKLKRTDPVATAACQKATGCTVDDVRAAYAALPPELKNPAPKERTAKGG